MGVTFVRTLIMFAVLVISLRVMGKRQLGELEPIELVVAILISNLASQPLADIGTPLHYGLVPVLTLLACQVLISWLTMKSIRLRRIICGKPSILIDNGVIVQSEMRKNHISPDELFVELRAKEVTDITTVKHAILETDGSLSVLLYAAETPVTSRELGIEPSEPGSTITVISNGRKLSDNMSLLGLDDTWLKKELKRRKVKKVSDVYLMTVDGNGNIFFAAKEEKQ